MPEEIFIIIVVAILAGTFTTTVKLILNHLKDQRRDASAGTASGGVTTSELEALMRRAVAEANAPLLARIEDLEEQRQALPTSRPERIPTKAS